MDEAPEGRRNAPRSVAPPGLMCGWWLASRTRGSAALHPWLRSVAAPRLQGVRMTHIPHPDRRAFLAQSAGLFAAPLLARPDAPAGLVTGQLEAAEAGKAVL